MESIQQCLHDSLRESAGSGSPPGWGHGTHAWDVLTLHTKDRRRPRGINGIKVGTVGIRVVSGRPVARMWHCE